MPRRPALTGERLRLGASLEREEKARPGVSRTARMQRNIWRQRFGRLLLLALLGLSVLYLLNPLRDIRLQAPDQAAAQAALDEYFKKASRRNLLVNTDELAETLTNTIPNAVAAKIEHDLLLSRLTITVTTQQPALRWQTRGVGYTVSDHGVVLGLSTEADAGLPIVFDEANVEIATKQQILPKGFADFVTLLDGEAATRGLVVRERYVRGSTRELRVVIEGRSYSARLDTQRGAGEQLEELIRLEKFFDGSGRRARDYVDLRIPGRAYWQ